MKFNVTTDLAAEINITEKKRDGIVYAELHVKYPEAVVPSPLAVNWKIPATDIYSTWSPSVRTGRSIDPDWWKKKTESRLVEWMPLHEVLSLSGHNRMCIAVSDAASPVSIATGLCEEDACLDCVVEFFTKPISPVNEYTAVIRLDMRDIAYEDSIRSAVRWWEESCGYKPAEVPESARMPMDSLWYSFHQNLIPDDIISECRRAKALGMDTVLIDDGWQTDDNGRGYSYCGDWRVAKSKIGDMRELVDRIHAEGMKVILWFCVPYVGIHADCYRRFSGMYLNGDSEPEIASVFDPRYAEVREYLMDIYANAVENWDLDGLKLDFIDSFTLTLKSVESDSRRDIVSLEDAVDTLMSGIMTRLRAIKPDIMIEFRQTYVGPAIRGYGNMLRVGDCPADPLKNRSDIVNLRLTSGKTAVHSDMLMWNVDSPVEIAALQLCSVLYGVPQISMRIDRLPSEHVEMLKFYLDFWRSHRDILLDGDLYAKNPESEYSIVSARKDGTAIYTSYTDPVIDCGGLDKIIAVNSGSSDTLILKGALGKKYRTVNCLGKECKAGTVDSKLFEVKVSTAGMVFAE